MFPETFAIVKQYVRRDLSGIEQLRLLNTPHNIQSRIYTLSKKPLDSKEILDSISHSGSSGKEVPISLFTLLHTLVYCPLRRSNGRKIIRVLLACSTRKAISWFPINKRRLADVYGNRLQFL